MTNASPRPLADCRALALKGARAGDGARYHCSMPASQLRFHHRPKLTAPRLVLAFAGWMDGGDVSTGTVKILVQQLKAAKTAEIDPDDFYIFNFPGSMEVTALFRPAVEIREGAIRSLDVPSNTFYAAEKENLIFFVGKEPNLRWGAFADCVFEVVMQMGVSQILFVGSFAGSVPHTREPRLYAGVSEASLKSVVRRYGMRLSTYEGPGSFATFLMTRATREGVPMISLVAEIPSYVEGANPPSINAISKRLGAILGLQLTLSELRGASDEWESRVSAAVAKDEDLQRQIKQLEEQYDDELIEGAEEA